MSVVHMFELLLLIGGLLNLEIGNVLWNAKEHLVCDFFPACFFLAPGPFDRKFDRTWKNSCWLMTTSFNMNERRINLAIVKVLQLIIGVLLID